MLASGHEKHQVGLRFRKAKGAPVKVRRVSKRTYFRALQHNSRQITNDALRYEMVFFMVLY